MFFVSTSNITKLFDKNNSYSFEYQKNSYFILGCAAVVQEGNIRKTMAARGLVNGRGPRSGRDLVFRCYPPELLLTPQKKKLTFWVSLDPVVAEDIAQNSFMKLWLNRFSLQSGLSVKNYLCILSRNDAINYLRSANAKNICLDPQFESPLQHSSVEDWLTFAETNTRLRNNIEALPPQRRTIFKMSRFDHMSNTEIAVKLNLSVRTVEKHIELALKDLRGSMS